jgi:hypothetical protein
MPARGGDDRCRSRAAGKRRPNRRPVETFRSTLFVSDEFPPRHRLVFPARSGAVDGSCHIRVRWTRATRIGPSFVLLWLCNQKQGRSRPHCVNRAKRNRPCAETAEPEERAVAPGLQPLDPTEASTVGIDCLKALAALKPIISHRASAAKAVTGLGLGDIRPHGRYAAFFVAPFTPPRSEAATKRTTGLEPATLGLGSQCSTS